MKYAMIKAVTTGFLSLILIFSSSGIASAIPQSALNAIRNGRPWYGKNSGQCAPTSSITSNLTGSNSTTGEPVNGPRYPNTSFKYGSGPRLSTSLPAGANVTLEDAAKLLLRFVAIGAGANEADVVTEEKIIAVIGWMAQEGGSSANKAAYNTLNNAKDGILDDLEPIYNNIYGDGNRHPAFKQLEQGIEANVRFIEKAHYARLQIMLLDPTMTADKFVDNFDNLTYAGTTGQLNWAAGGYKEKLRSVVNSVKEDWKLKNDANYTKEKELTRPASQRLIQNRPILGESAKQALREVGITPQADDQLSSLDIAANSTGTGGSCPAPAGGSLSSAESRALATEILENENITVRDPRQLENIAAGSGPCPAVNNGAYTVDRRLLAIIAALGKNNTFTIASLHRGCTGSTIGAGTSSRHWAGKAVDISGSAGVNGQPISYSGTNEVIENFILEIANLFPAGDYGLGLPNSQYIQKVEPSFKEGNIAFVDIGTGPHIHIQVPRVEEVSTPSQIPQQETRQ